MTTASCSIVDLCKKSSLLAGISFADDLPDEGDELAGLSVELVHTPRSVVRPASEPRKQDHLRASDSGQYDVRPVQDA